MPLANPQPTVHVPDDFTAAGENTLPDRWWEAFGDPALNALVERGLANNPGLLATWYRLDQARAAARGAGSDRYPSLSASAGLSGSARHGSDPSGSLSLGLSASYEVDLWGRVEASIDAAELEAEATELDLRAAAISLSAQIASTWYQLVVRHAEHELLLEQLALAEQTMALAQQRYDRGLDARSDLLSQQQNLESLHAELRAAEGSAELLEHALAVLLGEPPTVAVAPAVSELAGLPGLPAAGVPSELLQRRPDVAAVWLRVQAADRNVGAAIAAQYPRLSLSAGLSTSLTISTQTLVGWAVNLAANLVAPLFDGGKLEADIDQARARLHAAVQGYAETVLAALADVENALTSEANARAALESVDRQLELARELLTQVEQSYAAGLTDYLRVLDALRSLQSLGSRRLQIQAELLQNRITLCRALAGSWTLERPEAAR
ncbi:MAG: efflux transporter outer membrane subunit [Deltaproteobacteria bacterium]|nr:efflux transporter outer membrane subunit [Deltaproteobacteria bacterium]